MFNIIKLLFRKMHFKHFEYKFMFVFCIYLIVQFHDKIITSLDFFLMPLNDDVCKTIPQHLSILNFELFLCKCI